MTSAVSTAKVRLFLIGASLLLSGCGPSLVLNLSQMTEDEMLDRASHAFVGVIESQHFDAWPLFRVRVPGDDPERAKCWKVLRRTIRVEMVIRGVEPRRVIDVYEVFGTCGASGDWNSTQDGDRALFLVRAENGRYHVVRDWWRSIFPITTGPHARLPLDESHPLWERIGLLNFWIESSDPAARIGYPQFRYNRFNLWRTVKLERGLARHPSPGVRVPACLALLNVRFGQDECWDLLSESDRSQLSNRSCCSATEIDARRQRFRDQSASWWWSSYTNLDQRRLFTAVSDRKLRADFCRLYALEYPGDSDNGCPADRPPPATIVTERGDIPLVGSWTH